MVKAKNVNKNLQNKNENRNITVCMEITSRSFNMWVIYRIKTLEHSMVPFLSHPEEFKRDLSEF